MATKTWAEVRKQRTVTPEMREQMAAETEELRAEMELHALRERRGVTQQALAERLSLSRPRVSTIENSGEDLRLSTVQRYVEALGGRLEIRAVFDDGDQVSLRSRAA